MNRKINYTFLHCIACLFFLVSSTSVLAQDYDPTVTKTDYRTVLSKNPANKNKLLVVVSFDGSKGIDRWQNILDFAKQIGGRKFTFFISGVYFLSDAQQDRYKYPPKPSRTGISDIGFGGTAEEVAQRIAQVKRAIAENHEIGSHLNGHFDDNHWTADMFKLEISQFNEFTKGFLKTPVISIRFPLLSYNVTGFEVLTNFGYQSILSTNASPEFQFADYTFPNNGKTIMTYPIPYVSNVDGYRQVLMDYNLYYEDMHRTPKWTDQQIVDHVVQLYLDEAAESYKLGMPLFLSHHFSLFEHSAYWDALQKALLRINAQYETRYLTVSELTNEIRQFSKH